MTSFLKIFKNKKNIFLFFFFGICLILLNADFAKGLPLSRLEDALPDSVGESPFSWTEVGKAITVGLARYILVGVYKITIYSGYLFSYTIAIILSKPITRDPLFKPGWIATRDLANMLIVLGFVVIGLATALRIREYEAKKLLWPLILIALFINFSNLFCGLIIDAANIVTTYISSGSGDIALHTINELFFSSQRILTAQNATERTTFFLSMCAAYSILYLAVAFTFLYLSIILVIRYAILAFLYILSPLAFAFWVYPASKKLWTEWWNNFIKWCFVGVFGSFTLFIATKLLPQQPNLTIVEMLQSFSIVLIFLFVGFKMTSKQSGLAAMAGAALTGLVTGGAGFALGALATGAKKGLGATMKAVDQKFLGGRGGAAVQAVSNTVGRFAETMQLKPRGSTAEAGIKKTESEASLLGKEYAYAKATGDQNTINRIRKLAQSQRGTQGAAALKVVSDANDLADTFKDKTGKVDYEQMAARIKYAESFGAAGIREKEEKRNPHLLKYNTLKVNNELKSKGIDPARATIEQRKAAEDAVVAKGFQKMDVSTIRSLPASQMDATFFENINNQTLRRAALEFSTDQRARAKSLLPELQDRRYQALGAKGSTPEERKAYFEANLSSKALEKKYNEMTEEDQRRWKESLIPEEKKIYEESGGIAKAARAYANIEKYRLDKASGGKVDALEKNIRTIKDFTS